MKFQRVELEHRQLPKVTGPGGVWEKRPHEQWCPVGYSSGVASQNLKGPLFGIFQSCCFWCLQNRRICLYMQDFELKYVFIKSMKSSALYMSLTVHEV